MIKAYLKDVHVEQLGIEGFAPDIAAEVCIMIREVFKALNKEDAKFGKGYKKTLKEFFEFAFIESEEEFEKELEKRCKELQEEDDELDKILNALESALDVLYEVVASRKEESKS